MSSKLALVSVVQHMCLNLHLDDLPSTSISLCLHCCSAAVKPQHLVGLRCLRMKLMLPIPFPSLQRAFLLIFLLAMLFSPSPSSLLKMTSRGNLPVSKRLASGRMRTWAVCGHQAWLICHIPSLDPSTTGIPGALIPSSSMYGPMKVHAISHGNVVTEWKVMAIAFLCNIE